MAQNSTLETRRLALQAELDAAKTQQQRNALGQFATPTALAREIVSYAARLLPAEDKVRFFDPAIGTGSFYSALCDTFPESRIQSALGFEIDPHYGAPSQSLWRTTPLRVELSDFTAASPPSGLLPNLLICNPPYVRHHHIVNGQKVRLQHDTEQACGVRIDGLAGLYCYFLGLSHQWLEEGGIAAWLIPSEFMNVNYGRAVQRYLLTKVNLLRIHRFDPNDVQFGDALVSSAVVIFRKNRPPAGHTVEFSFGGSLARPALSRKIPASALADDHKWTRYPASDVRSKVQGTVIGDLFRIKRGLATGDNRFFIMTKEQIQERQLPPEFFVPILPSPRYLPDNHIKADRHGDPIIDRQLYLLDCRLAEEDVKARFPSLWSYLKTGKSDVSERYLCRHRKPWYSQEDRPAAPFVCTYLGRSDKKDGKPFRFILNESCATAANVYLMLYPKPILAEALSKEPRLPVRIWEKLNAISAASLLDEGRVYGGGLHKLEPKELASVPADEIAEIARLNPDTPQPDLFEEKVA